jgi:uncharacterized protein (TIGR03435 family)
LRQRDLLSLATYLTRLGSDRPVIDKTGLTGHFALYLDMEKIMQEAAQSAYGRTAPINLLQTFSCLAVVVKVTRDKGRHYALLRETRVLE